METVIRFVITHEVKYGAGEPWNIFRKLFGPRQGGNTHETRKQAQDRLDKLLETNTYEHLKDFGIEKSTLKVMACPCYPGHFDPTEGPWDFIDPDTIVQDVKPIDITPWTKDNDENYSAWASEFGFPPGCGPAWIRLPNSDPNELPQELIWSKEMLNEVIVSWKTVVNGITFTIFND
jgi:hypothetical protein